MRYEIISRAISEPKVEENERRGVVEEDYKKENERLNGELEVLRGRMSELEERLKMKERVEEVGYEERAARRKCEKLEMMFAELDLKYKEMERAW